ncbi:hypothetical protein FTUN_6477 [Frigoriglobus tundricola]|uniref:MoxR-vWA-beta-propeller ternary system domain-containing protein n=1 Tax=Frigoriglobus tundricola TaxID=2774151 RepID=A0A6M5Z0Z4_9BACT|nr:hypothetical protein FTUN_6477 [Frigoriglobus tundricola]
MNTLDRAKRYLAIPRSYGDALGGLWWSSGLDAVERRDGTTLALADELRTVLDGAATRPPVPPFPFVLNLLHLMKSGGAGFEPLHRAFAGTRGAVHRGRNAGFFIADLCRGLPGARRCHGRRARAGAPVAAARRFGLRTRSGAGAAADAGRVRGADRAPAAPARRRGTRALVHPRVRSGRDRGAARGRDRAAPGAGGPVDRPGAPAGAARRGRGPGPPALDAAVTLRPAADRPTRCRSAGTVT